MLPLLCVANAMEIYRSVFWGVWTMDEGVPAICSTLCYVLYLHPERQFHLAHMTVMLISVLGRPGRKHANVSVRMA